MTRLPLGAFVVGIVAAVLAPGLRADDVEPWLSAPSFSVPAAQMLAAANALPRPENADAEFLLIEGSAVIGERGAHRSVRRYLYRIFTGAGVDSGSSVSESWAPWRQRRPEIRARVVTADGVQHDLDPSTLNDAAPVSEQPNVFSDIRVLQGPLPAVAPGAVAEVEIRVDDTEPLFEAGIAGATSFVGAIPIRKVRFALDAPESVALRWSTLPAGAFEESVATGEGRRRIRFEAAPPAPDEEPEGFVPEDADPTLGIFWSTGESWGAVADSYASIVEDRLADAGLHAAVQRIVRSLKTPADKIAALVEHLHREVRYTGVEFGWAGFVPARPSETLRRKYGDCKDKSVLLVGLLREAGIPAHLALLATGIGRDVRTDLPGLGLFDHAIVRVDTQPPVWIDATDAYATPGVLPRGVDGRLALVVKRGVRALERTPEARSADHRIEETREFYMVERGPARVIETTLAHGHAARNYRENHATKDPGTLREDLERYMKSVYEVDKLDRLEAPDAQEIAGPFRLVLESATARVGAADATDAAVPIHLAALTSTLAAYVPAAPTEEEAARQDEASKSKPRRAAFVVPDPFVRSWRYRIHPPEGFAALPLPERVDRAIGAARLTAEFRLEGGVVVVDAVMDSGPRRWTAEQYEDARIALRDLQREPGWTVAFEQVGEGHLKAGRIKEAVAEFRRLATLHPKEAIHRGQLASAFLAAGLGARAREEARAGVALEPGSSDAHTTLGKILMYDTVGRELRRGSDFAGAEAALRKAKGLDPKNALARVWLALVLQYGTDGTHFGPGARLGDAVDEYRAIRSELGNNGIAGDLLACLGHADRFEELRAEAAGLPASDRRNTLLIAAVAATSGVPAARSEAARLVSGLEARRELLGMAGFALVGFRRYAEAVGMIEEAFRGADTPGDAQTYLDIVRRCRRIEDIDADAADPSGFLPAFFRDVLTAGPRAGTTIRAWLSKHLNVTEDDVRKVEEGAHLFAPTEGLSVLSAFEIGLASMETSVATLDETSWLVTLRYRAGPTAQKLDWIVVREDGRLRILAAGDEIEGIGRLVAVLVDAGELERARRWLDLARERVTSPKTDDPVDAHPLALLWTAGDPADPLEMRTAAAAIVVLSDHPGEAVEILREAGKRAPADEAWRFDAAVAAGLAAAHRQRELPDVARRLYAAYPRSRFVRTLLTGSLSRAGAADELAAIVKGWADADPTSLVVLRAMTEVAQARRDADEAVRAFERLTSSRWAEPVDFNNHAWLLLATGRDEELAADLAKRAVDGSARQAAYLHTLAAVQADLGRVAEARETIVRKIVESKSSGPETIDAIVFGRIAEQLGEDDLAAAEYRKVADDRQMGEWDGWSTWDVAQRGLKRIEAAAAGRKGGATPK